MSTAEFIEKYLRGTTRKDFCSSVVGYEDLNGERTVYSYGKHYPLAKIINGYAFVNNAGYSNTTAKHINWAHSATADIVGYDNVFSVPLSNGDGLDVQGMLSSTRRALTEVQQAMASKKRKDTQVYKFLEHQEVRLMQTLQAVKAVA